MTQCRSPDLLRFDFFLFSILFSSSIACKYIDVGGLFLVFYACFYVLDLTKPEQGCIS
jgi:hypothetical protein